MPVTKGAKKAHRASLRKAVYNARRREDMKEKVKGHRVTPSTQSLSLAYAALDKAAKTGVIKKKTADRKKSRLAKLLAS